MRPPFELAGWRHVTSAGCGAEELLAQVRVEMMEAEGHDVDAKVRLQIIAAEEEKIRIEEEEVSCVRWDMPGNACVMLVGV